MQQDVNIMQWDDCMCEYDSTSSNGDSVIGLQPMIISCTAVHGMEIGPQGLGRNNINAIQGHETM